MYVCLHVIIAFYYYYYNSKFAITNISIVLFLKIALLLLLLLFAIMKTRHLLSPSATNLHIMLEADFLKAIHTPPLHPAIHARIVRNPSFICLGSPCVDLEMQKHFPTKKTPINITL